MSILGVIGYTTAGGLFLLLFILLCSDFAHFWRNKWLILATLLTSVWAAYAGYSSFNGQSDWPLLGFVLELFRIVLWTMFLTSLLIQMINNRGALLLVRLAYPFAWLGLLVFVWTTGLSPDWYEGAVDNKRILIFGLLCLTIIGLLVTEIFFKNVRKGKVWGIKHLCIGMLCLFGYDVIFYAHGLMYGALNYDLWLARGAVNSLVAPLVAVSIFRRSLWSGKFFVSREIAFYSSSLIAVGLVILLLSLSGYYLQYFGGRWEDSVRVVFIASLVMGGMVLLASTTTRDRLKLFISKHFYARKFDYQTEWLRLVNTLMTGRQDNSVYQRSIIGLAQIGGSSAGELWLYVENKGFVSQENWNFGGDTRLIIPPGDTALMAQVKAGEICVVSEPFPPWLVDRQNPWLTVPLQTRGEMIGFVVLAKPRVTSELGWEDETILITAGHQIAAYLSEYQTALKLVEAQRFEAFNKFSAFLMHDMKNLIAQQSLLVKNAQKHKHNPAFIDDVIGTIDNSVNRMQRLVDQLSSNKPSDEVRQSVSLEQLWAMLEVKVQHKQPMPIYRSHTVREAAVTVQVDAFTTALSHLIHNAQDATPENGEITVSATVEGEAVRIDITDSGSGMSEDFIHNRLFSPFESTKSTHGMGIGAYQAKTLIENEGGMLKVKSAPGQGSTFSILLPNNYAGGIVLKEAIA